MAQQPATQAPAVRQPAPTRPNQAIGSRQSKLSAVDQGVTNTVVTRQLPRPVQQPRQQVPRSRQSKLSVIDGEVPPRPQRAVSQRSDEPRIGGQRPPRTVRQRTVSPTTSARGASNFQTRNRRFTPASRGRVQTGK